MEIHKPKPVHSWRDFISEMTVIVLGILIALGGEQLIEMLHWHHQVDETEARLGTELGGNVAAAIVRLRTTPCIEKRLDEIAAVIDDAAKNGKLPPLGAVGRPSMYLWGHGTWDSALASQTTTHFPAQRLANLAVAYQFIARLGDVSQREIETWSELWTLVGPGRPFDVSAAQAARAATGRARLLGREMGLLSQGLLERVEALNLQPLRTARAAQLQAQIHAPLSTFEICQSAGAQITPSYGRAPFDEVLPTFERSLLDVPSLYK